LESVPSLDTTGLAASLPTLPVFLACHGSSSEHVGKNGMSLLTGSEQANVVRKDDLKVCPIEWNLHLVNTIKDDANTRILSNPFLPFRISPTHSERLSHTL